MIRIAFTYPDETADAVYSWHCDLCHEEQGELQGFCDAYNLGWDHAEEKHPDEYNRWEPPF